MRRRTALVLTSAVLAVATVLGISLVLWTRSPTVPQPNELAQRVSARLDSSLAQSQPQPVEQTANASSSGQQKMGVPVRLDPSLVHQPQPEVQTANAAISNQQRQAGPPSAEEAAQFCVDAMIKNLEGAALNRFLSGTFALPVAANVFSVKSTGENAMEISYLTDSGQYESAIFSIGALMTRIVGQFKGFELFAIVGPASVDCTQAAFYYVGGLGQEIGKELRKEVFGPTPVTTTVAPTTTITPPVTPTFVTLGPSPTPTQ